MLGPRCGPELAEGGAMRFVAIAFHVCTFALAVACGSDDDDSKNLAGTGAAGGSGGDTGGSSAGGNAGTGNSSGVGGVSGASSGGSAGAGGTAGSGTGGTPGGNAGDWIITHFAGDPVVTGNYTVRTTVETPSLVRDATGCCAKYSFDVHEDETPVDPEVGFVNVTIEDLVSSDAYGGGISSAYAPGLTLFLDNVTVEPNWPEWESYSATNYDGIVLDESAAIYAEDLTIKNWNADGAIDNKAPISQFVRLKIEGHGNRGIRYWEAGPHYLVDSTLENTGGAGEGSLLWFFDCDGAVVKIYDSTFNGAATVPSNLISCDNGSAPTLEYLTTDPRTTGEMHEMFSP
jgi:hypothetical protein